MRKVEISTVGFGYMGKIHTIAYRSMPICYKNFEYDIVLKRLITSQKLSNTIYEDTAEDIESIGDTYIADICTPNFMHSTQIKKLINMGVKNIYCEKPLAGDYEEEEKLVSITEKNGVKNQIGFVYRFLPAVIRGKKIIEEGIIGDVIRFNCHMYHQSYLNPMKPISWRLKKNQSGGGALVDLGIHMIDLIHYILGPITNVNGYTKTYINKRPYGNCMEDVDVDDFAHLDLTVNGCINGTLEVSRVAAGKGEDTLIEIFGTKGSVRIQTSQPEIPSVYILKNNTWIDGQQFTFKEVEEDINTIWPSSKLSLGWMVNCHMASLYSFIASTFGKKFNYIQLPTFNSSKEAMKIIKSVYDNDTHFLQ